MTRQIFQINSRRYVPYHNSRNINKMLRLTQGNDIKLDYDKRIDNQRHTTDNKI